MTGSRRPGYGHGANQYRRSGATITNIETVRAAKQMLEVRVALQRHDPDPVDQNGEQSVETPPATTLYTDGRPQHPDGPHRFNRRRQDNAPVSPPWQHTTLPDGYQPAFTDDERWERLGVDEPDRHRLEAVGVTAAYADACHALRIRDRDAWQALAAAGVSVRLGDQFSVAGYLTWDVDDPDDMAAYARLGIDPITAWSYRNHGIVDPDHICLFATQDVNGLDASWSMQAGWSPQDTVRLHQAGMSGLDAAAAAATGCRHVEDAVRVSRPRLRDRFRDRVRRTRLVPAPA